MSALPTCMGPILFFAGSEAIAREQIDASINSGILNSIALPT